MSQYSIFCDISGRVSLDTTGSDRVTAAAVAIETERVADLRAKLPSTLSKWRDHRPDEAEFVVNFLIQDATALAALTIDKNTPAWPQFWEETMRLHADIVAQSRPPAGFAKPANIATFWLFGKASSLATAHAVNVGPRTRLLDCHGWDLIERTIICDSDIQGEENTKVFKSFWEQSDRSQPLMESLGLRFVTRDVQVATEQQEPLLLLADYVAGIVQTAYITVGRIPLRHNRDEAIRLLKAFDDSQKAIVESGTFELQHGDIFGELGR